MRYKLVKHNCKDQRKWGGNDDTRKHLKIGEIYEGAVEIHSWHTKIIIDGKKFNSVCFEQLKQGKEKLQ